jgi:hypothetical protein
MACLMTAPADPDLDLLASQTLDVRRAAVLSFVYRFVGIPRWVG